MIASVLFSLFALVLKKIRKIVSEKIRPCPHVLEYVHPLLSFSNVLPNFILGGLNFMGMKSDGILKGTEVTCAKYGKYMKICFKLNKTLDFGNIIRKAEN